MSDEKLALCTPRSTWGEQDVFLCLVALREKTLSFELQEPGPVLQKKALGGVLPTLVHGEHWISGPIPIAEYLAETFPFPGHPRLFPANLLWRAWARQLMYWPRTELRALFAERPSSVLFSPGPLAPLSPTAAAEAERLLALAEQVVPKDGRPPLFEEFCIADVDFAFTLLRLLAGGFPAPAPVRAYAEAQWQRPSVRDCARESRMADR